MKISEIRKFVTKMSPIKIDVVFVPDKTLDPYIARAFISSNKIVLSRNYFKYEICNDNVWIQGTLLHEIGHFINTNWKTQDVGEFQAQKWAIDTAKKHGLLKVEKELRNDWKKYSWNDYGGKYRKYILARRMLKEIGYVE